MKNLLLKFSLLGPIYLVGYNMALAQLGVGTNLPQARLHVYNGTFLSQTPKLDPQMSPFYDLVNFDDDSVHHAFKWMPEKSALRVVGSSIYSNTLDPTKVGKFTVTSGFDTFATGLGASARGLRASATALATFASGQTTIASYDLSFAQGYLTNANGLHCVTIGTNLSNNYTAGTFVMGHSPFSFQSTNDHQFRMLFEGGYRFYSSNLLISGVMLPAGANAWSMISDVAKKEKFIAVDGGKFLRKIEVMPLHSWNYKGQDPKAFRHYGPMAQDFFRAFGSDAYGTIGTDTTINQADLDGVTLIAIQALARETQELQKVNDDLEKELASLRRRIAHDPGSRHSSKRVLMANRGR